MKKLLAVLALSLLFPMLFACQPQQSGTPNGDGDGSDGNGQDASEKETDKQKPSDFDDGGNIALDGFSDYVIVITKDCEVAERTAAATLRSYVKKMSGATLKIVDDGTPATEKEIVVGRTNRESETDRDSLGEDGFIIRTEGRKLFLLGGGARGTLYAAYTYLENYLGCRFYTADFERVPTYNALPFTEIEEDRQVPVFEVRNSGWADLYDHTVSAKLKLNCAHGRGNIDEAFGGSAYFAGSNCHTLYTLAELTDANINKEPCLTDPAVYETVLKNVRALLDANPGAKYVSVSQNDGGVGDACHCDNCNALREQLGGWSDHYVNFVNKIANAIKEDYPDVMVHTFAYKFTKDAPRTVVPADNVTVQLCTIEGCFRHPLDECTAHGADFAALIRDWGKVCNYLSIWDYTTDFYYYSVSFPNFDAIYENMRLFADNNAKRVYEQGNWQTTSGEFSELRAYLIARLLWDPYMSKEQYYAYMDEFLLDYYGEGAPYVREYIDCMQSVTADLHLGIYQSPEQIYPSSSVEINSEALPSGFNKDVLRNYKDIDWTAYCEWYSRREPNGILAKGKSLFDKARAATGDGLQLEHIEKSYIQIEFMESYFRYARLSEIRANITRLVPLLVDAHMGLNVEDAAIVSDTMIKNIMLSFEKEYEEYNEALFEKMFKHGVNYVGEARRLEYAKKDSYNFSNTPDEWGPNTWGI